MAKTPSRIHRGLVGERALVGESYLADPQLRREYDSEIAPRTMATLESIFAGTTIAVPSRVLDLGAGTGAAAKAIRARFGSAEIVSVDKVPGPGLQRADVTRSVRPLGVEGRFDLIVAAHLLNELPLDMDGRARLVAGWCRDLLQPDGTCILVEPALRATSRDLLAVRDRLIAAGLFVVAPCLLQAPCPALERERDFCHASAQAIAEGRSRVDFSYLVLRKQGVPCTDTSRFRIVSDPMKDKGRLRLFACGPAGRQLVMRLDRERSPDNGLLDEIERGAVVSIQGATVQSGDLRCARDTTIVQA
ncbi:MAG TPA: small ribosomal subunit Rsm22 family protein [Polyangia bacterium]